MLVKSAVAVVVALTCNLAAGMFVPIPTFPALVTVNFAESAVPDVMMTFPVAFLAACF